MSVSYDVFAEGFLFKVTEYSLAGLADMDRTYIVDGYMKRALADSTFRKVCRYDFSKTADDCTREFNVDVADGDLDEIVEIISEGMVCQWLKPLTYTYDNLSNVLNTRDFTTYSPAELLKRIGDTYSTAQRNFIFKIREYSYDHGDLTTLHI